MYNGLILFNALSSSIRFGVEPGSGEGLFDKIIIQIGLSKQFRLPTDA